jgi:hypothetical protein
MSKAVYNSAIIHVASNSARLALRISVGFRNFLTLSAITITLMAASAATDWNTPEQNLARKIAAVTGPAPISVTFENRSSLGKRESDVVINGLSSAMLALGLRFVAAEQASASLAISLSENATSYVWTAQIHPRGGGPVVAIVSSPRPEGSAATEAVPLSLRKIPLFGQDQPILDVTVLEEASAPTRIAVLDPEGISWYRMQNSQWQPEQKLLITHTQPWPRDLRGRLVLTPDHSLAAYLPGVLCTTEAAFSRLNCRPSDDPWPLLSGELSATMPAFPDPGIASGASTVLPTTRAFFAPTRNFFTGVLTPAVGKFNTVPRFFSAALLPRENQALWLFASTDGYVYIIDGASDQIANFAWGSDLASVKTSCGAGWQVLASSPGEQTNDSIRAYEFPEHDPAAVTRDIELGGRLTALWTESRGDTAVVVSWNQDTGTYEAFRLAIACGQ